MARPLTSSQRSLVVKFYKQRGMWQFQRFLRQPLQFLAKPNLHLFGRQRAAIFQKVDEHAERDHASCGIPWDLGLQSLDLGA